MWAVKLNRKHRNATLTGAGEIWVVNNLSYGKIRDRILYKRKKDATYECNPGDGEVVVKV